MPLGSLLKGALHQSDEMGTALPLGSRYGMAAHVHLAAMCAAAEGCSDGGGGGGGCGVGAEVQARGRRRRTDRHLGKASALAV